ncbi:excalibur calcium-binding domain-containing protein [Microvirga massiliensis]|uniref:excalibur calcium-binding domain-containing protein n=1 Tax=Microvirga massiliensis TaxID=1033741 RepID=UPI0007C64360|nr:excalibur calcium-binding domain-containing protein [Microvirga massiliensis]
MRKIVMAAFAIVMAAGSVGAVEHFSRDNPPAMTERPSEIVVAQRRSCKAASSCREAVEMWCNGYSRADGDGDGIPCENVCRSRAQVDAIKKEIGC